MYNSIILTAMTYLCLLVIIIYIYYNIVLAGNDPKAFTKNFLYNILTIIIPVILIFVILSFLLFDPTAVKYAIIGFLVAAAVSYTGYYFLQTTLSKYIFNKYLLYVVIFGIILFGASIIFTIFSGTLRKMTGWTGFVSNLLFYIPCLIRDGVGAAIQEYNSFSTTLIILFAIELIFIIMYFFMIPFTNSKIFPKTEVLIYEPILLNTGRALKTPVDISNNFGFSMWVYVNPGAKNKPGYAEESPIFSFLDASGKPHIQLSYSNAEQGNNEFIMYVGEESFPVTMPLQKWHNFVFNYVTYDTKNPIPSSSPTLSSSDTLEKHVRTWSQYIASFFYETPEPTPTVPMIPQTTVDMFINGNLERSFTYEKDIPKVLNNSTITIGTIVNSLSVNAKGVESANMNNPNRDGLYGSICNLEYYAQPITKMAMIYNYNLLTIRNPPI